MATYGKGASTVARRVRTNISAAQRARAAGGSGRARGSAVFRVGAKAKPKPKAKMTAGARATKRTSRVGQHLGKMFAAGGRYAARKKVDTSVFGSHYR